MTSFVELMRVCLGARVVIGSLVLEITHRTERCVMVGSEQRGLPKDPAILKSIGRENEACVGVYAKVLQPGEVSVGSRFEHPLVGTP